MNTMSFWKLSITIVVTFQISLNNTLKIEFRFRGFKLVNLSRKVIFTSHSEWYLPALSHQSGLWINLKTGSWHLNNSHFKYMVKTWQLVLPKHKAKWQFNFSPIQWLNFKQPIWNGSSGVAVLIVLTKWKQFIQQMVDWPVIDCCRTNRIKMHIDVWLTEMELFLCIHGITWSTSLLQLKYCEGRDWVVSLFLNTIGNNYTILGALAAFGNYGWIPFILLLSGLYFGY